MTQTTTILTFVGTVHDGKSTREVMERVKENLKELMDTDMKTEINGQMYQYSQLVIQPEDNEEELYRVSMEFVLVDTLH